MLWLRAKWEGRSSWCLGRNHREGTCLDEPEKASWKRSSCANRLGNRRKFDDKNHIQQMQAQKSESESHSVASNSLRPHWLFSPWNSPGHNTGVGSLSFPRGLSQSRDRLNPGIKPRRILYQLSYQESWRRQNMLKAVVLKLEAWGKKSGAPWTWVGKS